MGEYFKPLRRKIGVVTLLLACVFMAVRLRSFITYDGLNSQSAQFISSNGGLLGEILLEPFDFKFHYGSQGPHVKNRRDFYHDPKMVRFWRWRYLGFAYGSEDVELNSTQSTVTVVRFIVPYWSIAIPLTLVSAWLLLSKPHVAKSQPNPKE